MKRRSFTFRGKRSPTWRQPCVIFRCTSTSPRPPHSPRSPFLQKKECAHVNKDSRWNTRSEKIFNFNDIFDVFFNEEKRYTNSIQAFKHLSSCSIFQSQSIAYPLPFPPYPLHPPPKLSQLFPPWKILPHFFKRWRRFVRGAAVS